MYKRLLIINFSGPGLQNTQFCFYNILLQDIEFIKSLINTIIMIIKS